MLTAASISRFFCSLFSLPASGKRDENKAKICFVFLGFISLETFYAMRRCSATFSYCSQGDRARANIKHMNEINCLKIKESVSDSSRCSPASLVKACSYDV